MKRSEKLLPLCTAFLDDCYTRFDGKDLASRENVVEHYQSEIEQVRYSVMYFAKYTGCWSAIRAKVKDDAQVLYSIGAGPLFCLMGWYFAKSPANQARIYALDYLAWSHVCDRNAHRKLLRGILGSATAECFSKAFFPPTLPPQCESVPMTDLKLIEPDRMKEGCTVLFPMVLNHVLGDHKPVEELSELTSWFRRLERHAARIIIADMSAGVAPALWQKLQTITGLKAPPVLDFSAFSSIFKECYGTRQFTKDPEATRRTGISYSSFCRVTVCVFERGCGWRWIT